MDENQPYAAAIVGAGAAGLSAALVLARARRTVLISDDGSPRNAAASEMHGFVGLDGTSPSAFLARARADVLRYPGVTMVDRAVERVEPQPGGFRLTLASGGTYEARRLLLATGMKDVLPQIEGIADRWGRCVFVCPYCEGWEVRDRRIAVYAPSGDAVGLAQELFGWSRDLIVVVPDAAALTSDRRAWLGAAGVRVVAGTIARILGGTAGLASFELADGARVPCDALFVSADLRQRSDIPLRLGCEPTANGAIRVDGSNRTSVAGCYAAGDAVTHLHQVVLAAASGAVAAIGINDDLTAEDAAELAAGVWTGPARGTSPA